MIVRVYYFTVSLTVYVFSINRVMVIFSIISVILSSYTFSRDNVILSYVIKIRFLC